MAIPAPVRKLLLAVIVVAIGATIAMPLGRYADRDDAPGGVLIAIVIFVAATALAARIVNHSPRYGGHAEGDVPRIANERSE